MTDKYYPVIPFCHLNREIDAEAKKTNASERKFRIGAPLNGIINSFHAEILK